MIAIPVFLKKKQKHEVYNPEKNLGYVNVSDHRKWRQPTLGSAGQADRRAGNRVCMLKMLP